MILSFGIWEVEAICWDGGLYMWRLAKEWFGEGKSRVLFWPCDVWAVCEAFRRSCLGDCGWWEPEAQKSSLEPKYTFRVLSMQPLDRTQLSREWVRWEIRSRAESWETFGWTWGTQQSGPRRGGEEVGRPGECQDVDAKKIHCLVESGTGFVKSCQRGRAMDMETRVCALTTLAVERGLESWNDERHKQVCS